MRVYHKMPLPNGESSTTAQKDKSTTAEQDYLEMLAKEFNSIPDRVVPPPEPQDDDQSSALTQASKIAPKPEKASIDNRNVAIAKTIRSAIANMQIGK
jgi:hypothetical protein